MANKVQESQCTVVYDISKHIQTTWLLTACASRGGDDTTGEVLVLAVGWLLLVMTSAQQWMAWCILGPSDVWKMNVPTPVGVRLEKENFTSAKCRTAEYR